MRTNKQMIFLLIVIIFLIWKYMTESKCVGRRYYIMLSVFQWTNMSNICVAQAVLVFVPYTFILSSLFSNKKNY